ncbi:hypothetical protein VaNZ11_011924, partial [Volvox africanus]
HLPSVDLDFVKHAEDEYHSIFNTGKSEEVDAARFRLVWALVHSTHRGHQSRGLELCRAKLREQAKDKEYRYFAAVACYNMGQYIDSRRELSSLLQVSRRGLTRCRFRLCFTASQSGFGWGTSRLPPGGVPAGLGGGRYCARGAYGGGDRGGTGGSGAGHLLRIWPEALKQGCRQGWRLNKAMN